MRVVVGEQDKDREDEKEAVEREVHNALRHRVVFRRKDRVEQALPEGWRRRRVWLAGGRGRGRHGVLLTGCRGHGRVWGGEGVARCLFVFFSFPCSEFGQRELRVHVLECSFHKRSPFTQPPSYSGWTRGDS